MGGMGPNLQLQSDDSEIVRAIRAPHKANADLITVGAYTTKENTYQPVLHNMGQNVKNLYFWLFGVCGGGGGVQ